MSSKRKAPPSHPTTSADSTSALASFETLAALSAAEKKALTKAVAPELGESFRATAPKPKKPAAAEGATWTLPVAMTGKASPAKTAEGDEPVFAYIRSLPQPQRGIAERVDALAAKTLPGLKRAVKWGIAWYGVGDGWCFCCGGFAGHVKLTFGHGASLQPVPPSTPIGMGKSSRGVELASVKELDEKQAAAWMEQATAMPGFGGKKR